ncbi:MAG: hypothetical protein Q8920_09885 [Bacillota bacterium]|nr:hypothetical protein [Bacillota bacterium]
MKNLKVVLYDTEEKQIIEHETVPDGEIELSGANELLYTNVFLNCDEIKIGSKRYLVESRCFSLDKDRLILYVHEKV